MVMKVRHYTQKDKDDYIRMVKYCFNMSQEDSMQYIDQIEKYCRGFVAEENGSVISAMFYYPFMQNIRGIRYPMAGLGGVVTMPEARNRGLVRQQIYAMEKDMIEQGFVTSTLQPFKPLFYQNFGYANASRRLRCCFDVNDIGKSDLQFDFVRIDEPSVELFQSIAEAFADQYNGATYRTKEFWEEEVFYPWKHEKDKYYYLIRHQGQDVAYVIFVYTSTKEEFGTNIKVKDYGFVNHTGATGLFQFFKPHRDQVKDIIISVPENFDMYHFVPVNLHKIEMHSWMMFKVISPLEAMLRYHPPENLSFDFQLELTDPLYDNKVSSYAFRVHDGSIESIEHSKNILKTSIVSFSRMFIGRNSIHQLIDYQEAQVSDNIIKDMDILFPEDIVFIKDLF